MWTRDNLHVLRGLNSASVDLIYLDPPFNSNRTYSAPIGSKAAGAAFKDAWTFDDADRVYLALLKERDPAIFAIIEAARLGPAIGGPAAAGESSLLPADHGRGGTLVAWDRGLVETGDVVHECTLCRRGQGWRDRCPESGWSRFGISA